MVIRIYWASVTCSRKIDGDQTRLRNIIQHLKLESEWIDITTDTSVREEMRKACGKSKAMPPQIFSDDRYLGDVTDMEEFVEMERARDFFVELSEDAVDGASPISSASTAELEVAPAQQAAPAIQDSKGSVPPRHGSPTSSIENERPNTPDACYNETSKPNSSPPPRKNVLATIGAFESFSGEPKQVQKPRVLFTQSKSQGSVDKTSNDVDEERRRRILGLSSSDNAPKTVSTMSAELKAASVATNG